MSGTTPTPVLPPARDARRTSPIIATRDFRLNATYINTECHK
jgi:hypothetical protein